MFECVSGGECLPFALVCNERADCIDGSDEGLLCNSSCTASNNPCSQKCFPSPSGPVCSCNSGYILDKDKRTCEDEDECAADDQPPCSQLHVGVMDTWPEVLDSSVDNAPLNRSNS